MRESDDRDGLKTRLLDAADRYDGRYGWNKASLYRWLIEEGELGLYDDANVRAGA